MGDEAGVTLRRGKRRNQCISTPREITTRTTIKTDPPPGVENVAEKNETGTEFQFLGLHNNVDWPRTFKVSGRTEFFSSVQLKYDFVGTEWMFTAAHSQCISPLGCTFGRSPSRRRCKQSCHGKQPPGSYRLKAHKKKTIQRRYTNMTLQHPKPLLLLSFCRDAHE